jgi:hypothetical protein
MDLETRLRDSFAHQVTEAPAALDLPDTVVARGRRVRTRQRLAAGTGALAVVATVAVLSAAGGSRPAGLQVAHDPTPTPSAVPRLAAPDSWVQGLAHDTTSRLATPVFVGGRLVLPGRTATVAGVEGDVYAATAVAGGVVVSFAAPDQTAQLSFASAAGEMRQLDPRATFGHAVDPTGTKVAFGSYGTADNRVVEIATGRLLARATLTDKAGPGTPVGWVGDEVLLTTGDGAAVYAKAWNTRTGAVRTIAPERYRGAYGVVGQSDLVALHQGDGTCVAVSYLHQKGDLWTTCAGWYVGFSPDGSRLLLSERSETGQPQGATVHDAKTGALRGRIALPPQGVLSVGWSDDATVAAVVRVLDPAGTVTVLVVTCPTDGKACTSHDQLADVASAWVANARG